METTVVIVGAGPAGLAMAACLSRTYVSYVILEREDCYASLWRKRAYDRVHLHLGKRFCGLPHLPPPRKAPTFMPKDAFLRYLDQYVAHFKISPVYNNNVESAFYDQIEKKWWVEAKSMLTGKREIYVCQFLVVATGENSYGYMPNISGLDSFPGEVIHSCDFKSGASYKDMEVLVIGSGNSGMEICLDLANHGARVSIVIRKPFHVLTKEMVYLGMTLLTWLPLGFVDALMTFLSKLTFGDVAKYGIHRPTDGPFKLKGITGKPPVIDVGTTKKIKNGEIKVFPKVVGIVANTVDFENGARKSFDAIICATGYKSVANSWLKDYKLLLNDEGMPRNQIPHHWKGEKGAYCCGLSRTGLAGISADAQCISNDINKILDARNRMKMIARHDLSKTFR